MTRQLISTNKQPLVRSFTVAGAEQSGEVRVAGANTESRKVHAFLQVVGESRTDLTPTQVPHSSRGTTAGSVRAARIAGMLEAASATRASKTGALMNVMGSIGRTPNSSADNERAIIAAPSVPTAIPIKEMIAELPSTSPKTSLICAPRVSPKTS
jgi:hypothetical protein